MAREQLMAEMEEELQTAHEMQMRLMPVAPPHVAGFDIAGRCLTANHVGGDLFQYFQPDGKLAIVLADVTGHAMEAAIPVVMFSGILDNQMEASHAMEELFAQLNRSLCRTLDERTFVCLAMAEIDLSTRAARLANGGCPYPYHYRAATNDIAEIQAEAYPLGIRPDTHYPVAETQLEPGDRIILCSDGIVEAENPSGELFGFERTADAIRRGCAENLSAEALIDALIAEVKTFAGEMPQGDDQTVVVLRIGDMGNE
jgi:phosphoserine phosphatase RsbU/P